MAKLDHLEDFEFRWTTLSHYEDPYRDTWWHLFWGIVTGGSIIYAILAKDFLFLILSLIALIFFFHPIFYQPNEMIIKINKQGIYINNNFYSWDTFDGFEVFHNGERFFLYFVPKRSIYLGLTTPLEEYISIDEIRKTLKKFLSEYEGAIPNFEKWYRNFFK